MITFKPEVGWRLLLIIWGFAFVGTIFKLFFIGKLEKISVGFYILMGWLVVLEAQTLIETTPTSSLVLLAVGGLLYSIGVIFYLKHDWKYHHLIWHIFILLASQLHFIAVLNIL